MAIIAALVSVNCGNASAINTALNNANSGDTVLCTGSGWSSGTVTLPNNKNITLDGNGLTISGSARLNLSSSANYTGRVTNFTIATTQRGAVSARGEFTDKPWRLAHCIFNVTLAFMLTGPGPGPGPGSACDVNADGLTNVIDVQLCVNQATGSAACTTGDISKDSICNAVDIQRAVNAALGGTCVSP